MRTRLIHFLLTLDVEPSPVNVLPSLPKLFKKAGITGTIFVTGQISNVVEPFLDLGWSIQTHTHPNLHLEFNGSYRLADYSYSSQLAMIQRDKEMIEKNLNIKSNAFRAGKLSMNNLTLNALNELGFKIDSSSLIPYVFRLKAISKRPWNPYKLNIGELIEVPVTHWIDDPAKDRNLWMKIRFIKAIESDAAICLLLHPHSLTSDALFQRLEKMILRLSRIGDFLTVGDLVNSRFQDPSLSSPTNP